MRHTTVADVMSTNVISARPQDSFAHLTTLLRGAAIRAVPVGEAMMAIVLADAWLRHRGQTGEAGARWPFPR